MRWNALLVVGVLTLSSGWLVAGDRPRRSDVGPMVAVGDGFLAGFGSGGLVRRGHPGQVDAVPSLVGRQAGVRVPPAIVDGSGLPPQLVVSDTNGNGVLDAGEVRRPRHLRPGSVRASAKVRNLAVPGEDTASVFDAVTQDGLARALARGARPSVRDALKPILLDASGTNDPVSQLTRARALDPSLVLVWLGTTDALRLVPLGAERVAPVPAEELGPRIQRVFDLLAETGADLTVANVPDPTRFPILRRAAGEVTTCHDGEGRAHAVDAGALLSIALDPRVVPSPPCAAVLTPEDRERVRATVRDYNAAIAAAAREAEQRHGVRVAVVDVFALVEELAERGVDLDSDGAAELTTRYLGGIFSLDGIHLTRAGNALVANAFIAAMNARLGTTLPAIDIRRLAARDDRPSFPEEVPFGVIAPDDATGPLPRRLLAPLSRRLASKLRPAPDVPGDIAYTPAVVGAPASYFMFSGLETGEIGEFDDTLSCPVVTAPVCTGTRACQKTVTSQPSELRSRAMGVAEAFVRTYHFVTVTATPTPTEACAPMTGFDMNEVVPTCSADVCVQPSGQLRYRLFDRVNGVAVGSPTALLPPSVWRRVEVRVRMRAGLNDDECEFRLDGSTVAASVSLNLGTSVLDSGFVTNRQGAYPQPPTPGAWLATFDDVAVTQGQWPGRGRIIARQGRVGIPTFDQFVPVGAPNEETAWSDTPASTATRAESPDTGDPLAETMLIAPFNSGLHAVGPLSQLAACQTWIHANTSATPDRQYAIRRRVAGVNTDAVIPGINTVFFPFSDGLLGGFWVDTLANVNAAEIGARKSGGAGGARMVVNDAWLACEYEPPAGEPACATPEVCAPSWGTSSPAVLSGFANFADGVSCTTGAAPSGYIAQSCAITLGAVPGGNVRCAVYDNAPEPNRRPLCSSPVTAALPGAINTLPLVGCPTLAPNTPYWIVWNTDNNGIQYGVGPQRCSATNGASRYVAAPFPTGAWSPDPWGTTLGDTCQLATYLTVVAASSAPTTTSTSSSSSSSTSTSSTSTTSTSVSSTTSSTGQTTTSTTVPTTSSTTSTSTTSTTSTSSTSTTLSGLVAAYGFNEAGGATVLDASGSGNPGTINGATRITPGRLGAGALLFDGVDDWVTVADAASLDLTAGMTIEAWVFPTVTPTGWRAIVTKERPGDLAYFLHAANGNNRPVAGGIIGGAERLLNGPAAVAVNAWTHLAVTYNGTSLVLYVNGAATTQALTGTIAVSANPLRIGGSAPFGEFFQGRIDEVRIYNRALSAAEIATDMNQGIGP